MEKKFSNFVGRSSRVVWGAALVRENERQPASEIDKRNFPAYLGFGVSVGFGAGVIFDVGDAFAASFDFKTLGGVAERRGFFL